MRETSQLINAILSIVSIIDSDGLQTIRCQYASLYILCVCLNVKFDMYAFGKLRTMYGILYFNASTPRDISNHWQ